MKNYGLKIIIVLIATLVICFGLILGVDKKIIVENHTFENIETPIEGTYKLAYKLYCPSKYAAKHGPYNYVFSFKVGYQTDKYHDVNYEYININSSLSYNFDKYSEDTYHICEFTLTNDIVGQAAGISINKNFKVKEITLEKIYYTKADVLKPADYINKVETTNVALYTSSGIIGIIGVVSMLALTTAHIIKLKKHN